MRRLLAPFALHPRLILSGMVGVAIGLARASAESIRRRAALQDESGFTLLMLSAAAATVSLCASIGLLSGFKELPDAQKPAVLALVVTVLASWFFLQLLFTLYDTHEFHGAAEADAAEPRGGLQFPGGPAVSGYLDFADYAFTIGMTTQTSDTAVTSPAMRGLTLAHAVLTFFFNTVILALSINIAASLI